ncbi:MAG: response regulator [Oscillatoria sp. PMC 1051.18]|nr:response regulator [Oscillatoria sp. PMC 1050.18]MEC5032626.1 response regulator [Oscillatoria sp. PMC 1051.18]
MQGNLNEIDIRSILQLIELGQRTGELFVEAYRERPSNQISSDRSTERLILDNSVLAEESRQAEQFWFVFFVNGQIIYAADSSNSNLSRLRDYLRRYKVENALTELQSNPAIASTNAPEYAYLWLLLENHLIDPKQGRSIIHSMANETLFDLLSISQGSFIFESAPPLAPQLTTIEIAPLVTKIMKQVQQWKQFYPLIQSPEQYPVIGDRVKLREALGENAYKNLYYWADGKTTLRQLSRYLNRDLLIIARAIYPYLQKGWVQMLSPNFYSDLAQQQLALPKQTTRLPRVVCIDDEVTVGMTVEELLQGQGYEVHVISDPIQALSQVFQIKPDLIFCDLAMPELDGYEICAMLRKSTAFRHTPIIMLTGKEGFIDRVKARMVGSTDYLTKPFGKSELLMLLEKYIGMGTGRDLNQNRDSQANGIETWGERQDNSNTSTATA